MKSDIKDIALAAEEAPHSMGRAICRFAFYSCTIREKNRLRENIGRLFACDGRDGQPVYSRPVEQCVPLRFESARLKMTLRQVW